MKKYIVLTVVITLVAALILIRYAIVAPARAAARNLEAINGIAVGQTSEAELLGAPRKRSAADFKDQIPDCSNDPSYATDTSSFNDGDGIYTGSGCDNGDTNLFNNWAHCW